MPFYFCHTFCWTVASWDWHNGFFDWQQKNIKGFCFVDIFRGGHDIGRKRHCNVVGKQSYKHSLTYFLTLRGIKGHREKSPSNHFTWEKPPLPPPTVMNERTRGNNRTEACPVIDWLVAFVESKDDDDDKILYLRVVLFNRTIISSWWRGSRQGEMGSKSLQQNMHESFIFFRAGHRDERNKNGWPKEAT